MIISAELIGFDHLIKDLAGLDYRVRNQIIKDAMIPAARRIDSAIEAGAPTGLTGQLKVGYDVSKVKFKRGRVSIYVGTWSNKKVADYAFQVETGHFVGKVTRGQAYFYKETLKNAGPAEIFESDSLAKTTRRFGLTHVNPNPFVRRAFDANVMGFFERVGDALGKALMRQHINEATP